MQAENDAIVGVMTCIDEDQDDTFIFSIVDQSVPFRVEGNLLKVSCKSSFIMTDSFE